MQWEELTIVSANEVRAAIENILVEEGAEGLRSEDLQQKNSDRIKMSGYFLSTKKVAARIPAIKTRIEDLRKFGLNPGKLTIEIESLGDSQWSDEWRKYYHVRRVTRYLTIVPSWEQYQKKQSDEKVIKLDPGKAFGTGTHPTTVLALRALEETIRGDEKVIDVGTGSGVLSIAARALGVKEINAFDIEEDALLSARKNIKLNPFATNIKVDLNNLLSGISYKADLIVANVLPEVLLELLPQIPSHLEVGGCFIASGIILAKKDAVKEAVLEQGLTIKQIATDQKWVSIIARKTVGEE
ncbi:ribosomal protein l11 methyltransferase [Liquorilactobacillus aquaticus DSM 21051]|uniref:Ribosomal protein L11 methyltransferase n=1 Tax=Liquorilactobacillus aquaticus DSM 21051 TaxID=1423725 RepID=A0A0R2CY37_9LACO|nr:50S ribosomal protein L11 methyltransferase [Liquorilactobacillus aquaticus]KRM96389.1 ribosomal protein l11 methyltransferase [Liquorilactobacillus aquaticus DSM 21051]